MFGVTNTDFKSTSGFGNHHRSNASATSSIFGVSSPAFPTGNTTGTTNAFPSSTLGFGTNSNQSNASTTSSIFGVSSPAFPTGFTTATTNAFPSSTLGFGTNSNQSNASTSSSIFGVSSPAFPTGFTTGTSNAFPSSTLGFGTNSNQSNASTTSSIFGVSSQAFPTGFTTGTSNAFPSSTFGFGTNSNQSTSKIFGVSSPAFPSGFTTGTSNAFPSTTSGIGKNSTNTSGFLFQPLKPNNSNPFGPSISSTTSTISTIVPSSSPFPQTSSIFTQPLLPFNNTTSSTISTVSSSSPFSLPKTNPNPSQPQPFVPSSTKPNPFSHVPSNGCDTPVNIFRNPLNNQFGPPFNSTTSSTISPVPSSSPFNTQPLPAPFQPLKPNNNNPFGPSISSTTSTISTIVPSSSPFPQTSSIFTQPLLPFNNTTSSTISTVPSSSPFNTQPLQPLLPSPNPFTHPKTSPNPSQPQPFAPSSTKPNPFSHVPSNGSDTPVNIFRNPLNNQFGPPFNNTTSSTISTVPSSSPFNTQPIPANNPMTPTEKNTIPVPTFINKNTTTVGYPHINGQQQQYVQANSVGVQSTLVADPFPTRSEIDRPLLVVQHGISSLPSQVPNKLSANRSTSSLRIRHVSPRLNSLPLQQKKTTPSSSEQKVAFFNDGVDRPGPFLPRENPRSWVSNSLPSPHSSCFIEGKCCEDKVLPCSSLALDTCIQEETEHLTAKTISQQTEDDDSVFVAKKHEDDVLALLPKLPNGDEYYTEPSLTELAAMEMNEPGSLSRVNDFVVGKSGYGNIKFLGETDVRHLDLGTIVQFKHREVIVYADEKTKPVVGEGMNKKAEVTLLNVKCVGKKTGKQYVDGAQVESYKEMLMKKGLEQGTEFVSYDPVRGEWRFRVEHF